MTLGRARILKAEPRASVSVNASAEAVRGDTFARRVPAVVVDAHDEAARVLRVASATAEAIVAEARALAASVAEGAAREAREEEIARIAAELLALRIGEEQRAEREIDRTIEIAVLLAERLVGDAIALDPSRVVALARGVLQETRGARRMHGARHGTHCQ